MGTPMQTLRRRSIIPPSTALLALYLALYCPYAYLQAACPVAFARENQTSQSLCETGIQHNT